MNGGQDKLCLRVVLTQCSATGMPKISQILFLVNKHHINKQPYQACTETDDSDWGTDHCQHTGADRVSTRWPNGDKDQQWEPANETKGKTSGHDLECSTNFALKYARDVLDGRRLDLAHALDSL